MPIATELNVDTSATAMDMANAMFGNGISIPRRPLRGLARLRGHIRAGFRRLAA